MPTLNIFGRPASTRRLLICTGPCCDRLGQASAALAALRERLAQRGFVQAQVGSASCVRRSCLGKCSGEPLAQVQPDETWYHRLSGENLLRIYEQHVLDRKPVLDLVLREDD
jgi:(2Fe-2S) ferredoxin